MTTPKRWWPGLRRLLLEGWRFIHHSYALVAQAHCLCLLRRGDIDLRFKDYPYYYPDWKPTGGIVDAEQQRALAAIRSAGGDVPSGGDVEHARRAERLRAASLRSQVRLRHTRASRPAARTTRWIAVGRSRARYDRHRHAVTLVRACLRALRFRCSARPCRSARRRSRRAAHADAGRRPPTRAALGIEAHHQVFLSVGAMTPNKGIDLLFAAFAGVAASESRCANLAQGSGRPVSFEGTGQGRAQRAARTRTRHRRCLA